MTPFVADFWTGEFVTKTEQNHESYESNGWVCGRPAPRLSSASQRITCPGLAGLRVWVALRVFLHRKSVQQRFATRIRLLK